MGWLEYTLLAIVAVFMALNQAVKDAPDLTEKARWLRVLGWANYLPLALLLVVLMLRLSADTRSENPSQPPNIENLKPAPEKLDPDTLPANISQAYVGLMSSNPTDLQEQKFLAAHAGKFIALNLEIVSIYGNGEVLRGQFRAGDNASIFVSFPKKWDAHLAEKRRGDMLHFRAEIVGDDKSGFSLINAEPL